MVRWSDLGGSLAATPRVALRWDYWWEILRRLLFSHVFLGHAAVAAALYFGGKSMFAGLAAGQGMTGLGVGALVVLALAVGPSIALVLGALLLPYGCWVVYPPGVRVLSDYLELPPCRRAEPPPFVDYLLWTLPAVGLILLLGLGGLLPLRFMRSDAYFYLCTILISFAFLRLVVRATLANWYAPEELEQFLHASRWQRRLLWLPFMAALGWGSFYIVQLAVQALVPWSYKVGVSPASLWTPLAVQWGLHVLVSFLLGIFYSGVLLLACARTVSPGTEIPSSTLHSITMPYTPGPVRRRPAQQAPRTAFFAARHAGRWAAGVAIVAGGLYFARMPLVDWYFTTSDESYRMAPARLTALGHRLDAGERKDRLMAAYVQAACRGDIDRMRWLRRIGLDRSEADPVALACAACQGTTETVQWMLEQDATLRPNNVVLRNTAPPHTTRSALSCAAASRDIAVVQALLARGAKPAHLGARDSAVNVAAEHLNWDMVGVLLRADPGASGLAVFSALDAARIRRQRPVQQLPRMLDAGLSLNVRDEFQRSVFHWAAMQHDLALARALTENAARLPAEVGPASADLQGALPWMHVLRKAELDGRPLNAETAELLRLLLPPQVDANAQAGRSPDRRTDALPEGWSARDAVLNDPLASEVLGAAFDIGRMPADPAKWWNFSNAEAAERFVRSASMTQLLRAENPDAPAGMEPRRLSVALVEAGWPQLALQVRLAVQGQRR